MAIIASAASLDITQGATANLTVTFARYAGFMGDVAVTMDGLPADVTASPLTIASGAAQGFGYGTARIASGWIYGLLHVRLQSARRYPEPQEERSPTMKNPSRVATLTMLVAGVAVIAAARTPDVPRADDVKYVARMTGPNEVPTNNEKGWGTATFTQDGKNLHYNITAKDLTGPATGAHIHIGGPAVAGGVAYGFKVAAEESGTIAKGTIDLTKPVSATVSADSLLVLLNNGNAYVNVHTAAHPGGEIRGQVTRQ
ncbi:MAG TPA: CHRD domain-containing protein [Gemmatimonadaceae bacterium]|nr:CHRD domain-containing protein [Gemmatimonadaceae bacterium]